jgi:hypothetical protein
MVASPALRQSAKLQWREPQARDAPLRARCGASRSMATQRSIFRSATAWSARFQG